MIFNSIDFVVFIAAVYAAYVMLPFRAQNVLLLAASYFFYGCWDWRFLGLIWASCTLDYVVSLRIEAATRPAVRRGLLGASLLFNLGVLFAFKYYGFFASSLQALAGRFGVALDWPTLNVLLPVGISFYTFQTLSYTLDVYRRQLAPARGYLDYLLFVSFFPQLVAGPIERAGHLLGQVASPRRVTYAGLREGGWLLLLGFFKKVVVADNLAPLANDVFNAPGQVQGLGVFAGLLAFTFQIYGDFSGYSDIARGSARLMGFDLMLNFRMPYFATTPSDFWRRWHISLSTWLRDYLYIGLGGNRGGTWMTYRNLLLTMVLGGLWHGAAWHFVAWGAFHGLLLVAYRPGEKALAAWFARSTANRLAGMALFFFWTLFGWLLFRVNHLADVPVLLGAMLQPVGSGRLTLLTLACFAGPLLLLEALQERAGDMLVVKRWPAPARLACYAACVAAIMLCGSVERIQFIYFQF